MLRRRCHKVPLASAIALTLATAIAPALSACSGAADRHVVAAADSLPAPADTAADTTADTTPVDWTSGACVPPATAPADHRVVFSGRLTCFPPPDGLVLVDEAGWVPVRDMLADCDRGDAIGPSAVDFATEYVVVLGVGSGMTCGFDLDGVDVRGDVAGPWVELETTNRSGGCVIACASAGTYVVAIALPRASGEAPTLCRRVHPGCT